MTRPTHGDEDSRPGHDVQSQSVRNVSHFPEYFVVRRKDPRDWFTCARFRLLSDAMRYVVQHQSEGPFEVLDPAGKVAAKVGAPPAPRGHARRARKRSAPTIPNMRIVGGDEDA